MKYINIQPASGLTLCVLIHLPPVPQATPGAIHPLPLQGIEKHFLVNLPLVLQAIPGVIQI